MKTAVIKPEEPFSGITIPVYIKQNNERLNKFLKSSRELYASEHKAKQKKLVKEKKVTEKVQQLKAKGGLPALV